MATRIRLQRYGKKGKAFFHIVVADSRSKRDGKYIEKIGSYNPNTNPATIDIDFERSLHWVQTGAESSETARAILSYKGVLMKDHLLRGVSKGALTIEQAEAKFNAWAEGKTGAIDSKKSNLAKAKADAEKSRLAAEREVSEARAAAIAAAAAAAEAPEVTEEVTATEESVETVEAPAMEEAVTEALAAEEVVAEEASVAEESAEAPAEEATEAPAEEENKGE